ncbi:unnamed protein product [Acanthoscelides obtectus]|uniref:MADF domain-containing protein n=1 Tax=Acanthoscelides obtectus TaxID=200917 RepID=A0A9P0K675_ACAOB|nr:unnamed protein product [Acanthoscelides obtectus]CAK1671953.1 hypothetical protein AOBTE_LOCUS28562 [Acanthoscelides obtectus]
MAVSSLPWNIVTFCVLVPLLTDFVTQVIADRNLKDNGVRFSRIELYTVTVLNMKDRLNKAVLWCGMVNRCGDLILDEIKSYILAVYIFLSTCQLRLFRRPEKNQNYVHLSVRPDVLNDKPERVHDAAACWDIWLSGQTVQFNTEVVTISRERENTCLEEFIAIYRNELCLWQVKSKDYHDRGNKEAAYLKLMEKMKEIDHSCTKSTVLKKNNNLRSSFRKDAKTVKDSMRTGSGADEVYHPKLWYYDLLKFVEDQEVSRNSRSNISDDEESENEGGPNRLKKVIGANKILQFVIVLLPGDVLKISRFLSIRGVPIRERQFGPPYTIVLLVVRSASRWGDDAHMLAVNGPKAMRKVPEFVKALKNSSPVLF